jgi:hypothetical protein
MRALAATLLAEIYLRNAEQNKMISLLKQYKDNLGMWTINSNIQ